MPLVTQVIVISILCSLIMTAIVLFTLAGTSSLHSTALFKITGTQDNDPNFFFGLLGSCAQSSKSASYTCSPRSIFAKYDLSLLHGDIASQVIKAPPTFLAVFAYLFIALQFVFLVMFFMISLCWPRWFKSLDKSWMINTTTLIGFVCTLGSLTCFSIFLLLFAETTQAFNSIMQGRSSEFTANIGNGFLLVWIASVFLAIPLFLSLLKSKPDGESNELELDELGSLPVLKNQ